VVIQPDNEDNAQVYGMTARDILTGADKIPMEKMPEAVRVFPANAGAIFSTQVR